MKTVFFIFLLAAPGRAGLQEAVPEPSPRYAGESAAPAVEDRLITSLFFRGELADLIIEAGAADRFVSLAGLETNAGVRSALLAWIRKNPARAAQVYLSLKGGGRLPVAQIEERELSWELNPSFLAAIKNLNDAAGNASVPRETLEMVSRRLYGGPQAGTGSPVVGDAGGKNPRGTGFFSGSYADYRLDRAGLEREIAQAGAWLASARGEGGRIEIEGAYSAAFSLYSEFIVAASALKGRAAVTGEEALRLEELRTGLRSALGALALRARISSLAAAEEFLKKHAAEPGAGALLAAASKLKGRLGAAAARLETGGVPLADLGRLVNSSEDDFSALYLGYSAYAGLVSLKERAVRPGFSCLYDYAVYRYLAAFFPGAAYPSARAELAAAAGAVDGALLKAGSGDLAGALSGFEPGRAEAAAGQVRAASAFNRRAQFFLWGLLFRPVEYKVSVRGGRAVFSPAVTVFEAVKLK